MNFKILNYHLVIYQMILVIYLIKILTIQLKIFQIISNNDIIELINHIDNTSNKTDIKFFRENKNNIYYPVENILLNFINLPNYCNKLKATIIKVIKEKNDNKVNVLTNRNISYEELKQRISNLICGNIYPKLAKFIPQIKLRTNIHNQLVTLINSFNIDDKFC